METKFRVPRNRALVVPLELHYIKCINEYESFKKNPPKGVKPTRLKEKDREYRLILKSFEVLLFSYGSLLFDGVEVINARTTMVVTIPENKF